jgi:prepilin-type N-terminal cleavage/methylation domain-containing protein
MRPNRGFTLIEVLVAASVLAIMATALFGLLSTSLSNLRKVEDLHRYEMAAQDVMNRVLSLSDVPVPAMAEGAVENSNAHWVVSIDPWAPSSVDKETRQAIVKVRVVVTWPGRSTDRNIELESLKTTKMVSYDLQNSIQAAFPQ